MRFSEEQGKNNCFITKIHTNMAEGKMSVYCDNGTLVLAKHVPFTLPFLHQTFEQNYLNSM